MGQKGGLGTAGPLRHTSLLGCSCPGVSYVPQRLMLMSWPLGPGNGTLFGYRIFARTVSSVEVVQEGGGREAVNDWCVLVTDAQGGSHMPPGQALSDVATRAGMPGAPDLGEAEGTHPWSPRRERGPTTPGSGEPGPSTVRAYSLWFKVTLLVGPGGGSLGSHGPRRNGC